MGFDVSGMPSIGIGAGKLIYNPDDTSMQHWEIFPSAQIESCRAIAQDIIATYPIQEVVGHHDIAIMGKFDPGPLFDLASLDARVLTPKPLGLATRVRSSDGFLNLRAGPSTSAPVIKEIPHGDPVHVRSVVYGKRSQCIDPRTPTNRARYLTKWASVDTDGTNRHAGYVHMSGLAETPLTAALSARL